MTDSSGALELRLAHADRDRIDGGTLRLDQTKRLVTWVGAPGEIGCKEKIEARFDEVKSVTTEDGRTGFIVEFKTGKLKKLRVIPLPHAAWLAREPKMQETIGTTMKYGSDLRGPDGASMTASGSAAGAGPTLKKIEVPADVSSDTRKAVDAIKQALEGPKGG